MKATATLRVAAVLHGDGPAAERRARALGAFLRDGLRLPPDVTPELVTYIFLGEGTDEAPLVALAPTPSVRLLRAPTQHAGGVVAALADVRAREGVDLFVLPCGPLGTESAARLAAVTGGSALTGVGRATVTPRGLTCERAAYSNHLNAALDLGARPWCVAHEAGWDASPSPDPPPDHVVERLIHVAGADPSTPAHHRDAERLEAPPVGDLETARFLVVAGRGAGSRGGVERIAVAAARLGAVFGVTRPVVMNGWAAPDRQVGVSGTRTAPAVCVVAGASGAPAFLWGVERAGFIAAVDTDAHAPIAGEADAVVVDDAVAVLEALAGIAGADA